MTTRKIKGNQEALKKSETEPYRTFDFTFTQPVADLLCHLKMKSEAEQVQKARNGYVSSCEAAKRGGEAAEVAPKGRLINVASGTYCCFTTVPSGPHCYTHANDG